MSAPVRHLKSVTPSIADAEPLQTFCTPNGEITIHYDPDRHCLRITCPEGLHVETQSRTLTFDAAERILFRADTIEHDARHTRITTQQLEIHARVIRERAERVLREARDLLHQRVGHLRTLARDSIRILGRTTTIRSQEDTSIDGRRVFLG